MRRVLCALILLAIAGCAGQTQAPASVTRGLPALSELAGIARSASGTLTQEGDDALLTGGDVVPGPQQGTLLLTSMPDTLAWAIWRFDTGAGDVISNLGIDGGLSPEYWVAISDYNANRWEQLGLHEQSASPPVGDEPGRYSNGTHTFVAVIYVGGASGTVNSVSLEIAAGVNPSIIWQHTFGSSEAEQFTCADIDSADNILCAGMSNASGGGNLLVVAKYAPDGSLLISKQIKPAATASFTGAHPLALRVLSDDGVLLAVRYNDGFNNRPLLIKLDAAGAVEWSSSLTVVNDGDTTSLAEDGNGNIYLSSTQPNAPVFDVYLISLDADGNPRWYTSHSGNAGPIVADASGVTFQTTEGFTPATYLTRLDLDGNLIWSRSWSGFTEVAGLTMVGTDIVMAGWADPTPGAFGDSEGIVLRFDSAGTLISQAGWKPILDPAESVIYLTVPTVDEAGNAHFMHDIREMGGDVMSTQAACLTPSGAITSSFELSNSDNTVEVGGFGAIRTKMTTARNGVYYFATMSRGQAFAVTPRAVQPITPTLAPVDSPIGDWTAVFATTAVPVTVENWSGVVDAPPATSDDATLIAIDPGST